MLWYCMCILQEKGDGLRLRSKRNKISSYDWIKRVGEFVCLVDCAQLGVRC